MTPASDEWTTPGFLDEARSWVDGALAGRGLQRSGEGEQTHVRPWSTTVRFGVVGADAVWCKANAVGTAHEPALVAAVAALEPELVPDVVAVDTSRAWSLTVDVGRPLREAVEVEERWDVWSDVLLRYASAQLRIAEAADEILATGIPVVTPARMPALLRSLVDELSATPVDDGGLDDELRRRLDERTDALDESFAELAAAGMPPTIQHDDLHGGNVCVSPGRRPTVIDWGDASWGFPLGTMLVTLDAMAANASCAVDDPRVVRVRDAYLEPFTARWDRADLVRWTDLARRLGALTRAQSWRAALLDAPPSAGRHYGHPARQWLGWLAES